MESFSRETGNLLGGNLSGLCQYFWLKGSFESFCPHPVKIFLKLRAEIQVIIHTIVRISNNLYLLYVINQFEQIPEDHGPLTDQEKKEQKGKRTESKGTEIFLFIYKMLLLVVSKSSSGGCQ